MRAEMPAGSCPFGYVASGAFCVPSKGASDAIPKLPNGTCPGGLARKQHCVPALGVVMSASMQAPGAPAESQIPAANNHPLTVKAASWRVLIANQ
jgi:hypothetical protein